MSISNDDIYGVLLDIKQDLGAVKAQTAMQGTALAAHAARTEVLANRVDDVIAKQSSAAGADLTWRRVINAGVGLAGAAFGAAATVMTRTHR